MDCMEMLLGIFVREVPFVRTTMGRVAEASIYRLSMKSSLKNQDAFSSTLSIR